MHVQAHEIMNHTDTNTACAVSCCFLAENFVEFSPGNCLCSDPLGEFPADSVRDCADNCLAHPSCAAFQFGTGLVVPDQCVLFSEACTSPCENPTEEKSRVIFNLACKYALLPGTTHILYVGAAQNVHACVCGCMYLSLLQPTQTTAPRTRAALEARNAQT